MRENKKGVVPRLRFPEFRDAGPWEVKRLGELADRIIEKVGPRQLVPVSISAGRGFVTQKEKFGRDISGRQYACYIYLKKGQFAYNKGNSKTFSQGAIYYLRKFDEVAVPNTFYAFEFKGDFVPEFFIGYFENNFHGRQLQRFITSSARSDGLLNISVDDFFSIILPTPKDREEQQKIADCLTSLDELITLQAQKLDALKAHKKGLMLRLFPREGETTPRLRFPEFRDAGPWELKRLEELYRFIPTRSFSRDRLRYDSGEVRNIHYGDIHTKFHVQFDIEREKVPYIVGLEKKEFDENCFCSPGDIIFADASEDFKDIGKAIEIVNIGSEKIVAGLHTLHAKQITNDLIVGFGGYLFQIGSVCNQIRKQAQGTKVLGISASRLKLVNLFLPQKPEQQKIADYLSSLDELITLQAQLLDALKAHKKTLMQQLFPQEVE